MAEKNLRLIIIDSNAMLHRAYHALPPLSTKQGEIVNAVYGFLLVFFKAIKELKPDFIAAAFDVPGPTFRHKTYELYKATRAKTPDDLSSQIPKIKDILKCFNIQIFEKEGYEADDVIGTIVEIASKKQAVLGLETIIISGDLDTLQLVDENTKAFIPKKGLKETMLYDPGAVKERYQGLEPRQLTDFRALKGDPSDNIPGVFGVGEKTAINLLIQFGSLENIYREIAEDSESAKKMKASLKEKLLKYKDQAFVSKKLAELDFNVPIIFDLESCRWGNYNEESVKKILQEYEFHSLVNRLPEVLRTEK